MKKEDLFLLINDIDERLIAEADDEPVQASETLYEEKRIPFREIAALAACVAVLVFTVFSIIKYRVSEVTPPNSTDESSSAVSSESESSSDQDSSDDVILVTDPDFPDVYQAKVPQGSFEDEMRKVILRAKTVEELESAVKAADTENRVREVKVTKKTNKPEYYKTGEPVMEGPIGPDMMVYVYYDEKSWLRYCIFLSAFDTSENVIIDYDDFINRVEEIINSCDTFSELKKEIRDYDKYERMDKITAYMNMSDLEYDIPIEADDFALEKGMAFLVEYDQKSYRSIIRNITELYFPPS